MKYLLLTLLLILMYCPKGVTQSYSITVKELDGYLYCKNKNFSHTRRFCLVGVDIPELSTLCGMFECRIKDEPLNLPSLVISDIPNEIKFPASGTLSAILNVYRESFPKVISSSGEPLEHTLESGWAYTAVAGSIRGSWRLPEFTLELTTEDLPESGKCKNSYAESKMPIKNRRLTVDKGEVTQVMGAAIPGSGELPAELVAIPYGQLTQMKTNYKTTTPLADIKRFKIEICNIAADIEGFIDISIKFHGESPTNYASWNFSGGLRVTATPQNESLLSYIGSIDQSAIVFDSDTDGSLKNAEEVAPEAISATFRYEENTNSDENVLGWMEIDLESISDQNWQPFQFEWVYPDGRPHSSLFPNVYALGLGQLMKSSPGTSPMSLKLPVLTRGTNHMTLMVPAGPYGNSLTIDYGLFLSHDREN